MYNCLSHLKINHCDLRRIEITVNFVLLSRELLGVCSRTYTFRLIETPTQVTKKLNGNPIGESAGRGETIHSLTHSQFLLNDTNSILIPLTTKKNFPTAFIGDLFQIITKTKKITFIFPTESRCCANP